MARVNSGLKGDNVEIQECDETEPSECSICGDYFVHRGGLCAKCCRKTARRLRLVEQQNGKVRPFFVACIGIDRCYGGPEEGGWWYDAIQVLEVRKAWDWQTALKHARELQEEHPTCPRGRHSVIGGTDTYVRTFRSLEDLPEETTERPRYE